MSSESADRRKLLTQIGIAVENCRSGHTNAYARLEALVHELDQLSSTPRD